MTFRGRLVALTAAAVAAAVALACVVTYIVVRRDLRGQVDGALRELVPRVALIGETPAGVRLLVPSEEFGGPSGVAQAVTPSGDVVATAQDGALPVDEAVRAVAAGRRAPFFSDARIDGVHVRLYTARDGAGRALQVARPLTGVDETLGQLRWILAAVTVGGVALAAGLGVLVSRATVRPVQRLTETAERVARTGDLAHRIDERGDDEPARLARAFNAMLAALGASRDAQRQLVADASHELRTPLTSARANIELLQSAPALPAAERERALASVRGQLEDLTVLVGDLVDLARPGAQLVEDPEDVRLDALVAEAVVRARRHAPGVRFEVDGEPCLVRGSRSRLDRAVANLLDNAVKFSPPGAAVEVTVRDGEVAVRDHGPGIAPADLPHVFDRFWRAPAARGLPGSGLGLAIVRQVAEAHGGRAAAEAAAGGGARLRLALPASARS